MTGAQFCLKASVRSRFHEFHLQIIWSSFTSVTRFFSQWATC